jgi:hypothetical protein
MEKRRRILVSLAVDYVVEWMGLNLAGVKVVGLATDCVVRSSHVANRRS